MLSCPSNGEHCDRHPRFLAGLRVDCGCGNDHHQLCVVCIRHLRDQIGSSDKPCPITLCRQLIAHCGGSADIKKKLNELIEKLQADQTMTKMDPAMPLPNELTTEIFRCVDSLDMPPKLLVSRVIHTQFLANARKNGWNTDSANFGFFWHGGRDVVTNINETNEVTSVMALRPFGRCQQQTCSKQQINYFEVKMDRFVENSRVLVGLGGPGPGVDEDPFISHAIGISGSFEFAASLSCFSHLPAGFSQGDVVGCGLISTQSHWKTKRQQIFFTKNGEPNGSTIWFSQLPTDHLYPKVIFRGHGTQVTANFEGNPAANKPFRYNLSKINKNTSESLRLLQAPKEQRKKGGSSRKRKAAH